MDKESVMYIHNGILFSLHKEGISVIYSNDGTVTLCLDEVSQENTHSHAYVESKTIELIEAEST